MDNDSRRAAILEIAQTKGEVLVDALSEHFGVAPQTVRRDLTVLTKTGQLRRKRGGAVLASGLANIDYVERQQLNAPGKAEIGKLCAAAIPDNATVFINIGTTAEAVARELLNHNDLLVVTNSLNTANILSANPNINIVVAGGTLRRADGGLLGNLTTQVVDFFKFDYAVISCAGIDVDGELLDFDLQEVHATQAIIRRTRYALVVADSSKILRTAPGRIGTLSDIETLFTDQPLTEDLARSWSHLNFNLSTPAVGTPESGEPL